MTQSSQRCQECVAVAAVALPFKTLLFWALGEESEAKKQPQEVRQVSEATMKTHGSEPSKPSLETCVKVSHAIHGWTIAVFLPEKALFKDLRHSLATYFLQDNQD